MPAWTTFGVVTLVVLVVLLVLSRATTRALQRPELWLGPPDSVEPTTDPRSSPSRTGGVDEASVPDDDAGAPLGAGQAESAPEGTRPIADPPSREPPPPGAPRDGPGAEGDERGEDLPESDDRHAVGNRGPTPDATAEDVSSEAVPGEDTPSEEDPSECAPSECAPSEEDPSEEDPSECAPSEEDPSECAPSEEDPSAVAPSRDVPSEEGPLRDAPSRDGPSGVDPREDASSPPPEAPAGAELADDAHRAAVREEGIPVELLRQRLGLRALYLNVLASQGLLLVVLVGAAIWTDIPAAALGIASEVAWIVEGVAVGLGLGLALYVGNELAAASARRFGVDYDEGLRELLAPETLGGWAALVLVVLPVIAAFEEVMFRAALIGVPAMGFELSPWALAVASSVVFALGHNVQGQAGVLVTGILGLVLAAAFVITGSLLVVIVAHYVVNLLEFVVHEGLGWDWAAPIAGESANSG